MGSVRPDLQNRPDTSADPDGPPPVSSAESRSPASSPSLGTNHHVTTSESPPSEEAVSSPYDIPSPALSESQGSTHLHHSTKVSKSHYVLRKGRKTIYTAGRPPWYDANGQQFKEAFVIGLCGGSASGKTTVANNIIKALDVPWVVLMSMDSFYREYDGIERERIADGTFDFDHPSAIDFDHIITTLTKLKAGKNVEVPVYNFTTHSRERNPRNMYGANVIIFEGIHAFFDKRLTDLMDIKIFVDTDADVRLARRLVRDILERGRDLNGVLQQYDTFVKPSFQHYIAPTMAIADIIIPRGGENTIALDLIVDHIKAQLQQREFRHRTHLLKTVEEGDGEEGSSPSHSTTSVHKRFGYPETLFLTPKVPQITGLHTFIRNKDISRKDFIFYSHRLSRIALEYAVSFMPHEAVTIDTPQGKPYEGMRIKPDLMVCGVSIIRAGETMEHSLLEVCKDVRLGKILIQTNYDTGEPELFYLRLPQGIRNYRVLLLDPTVATGATAMMAIRVLLDHEVPEENIQFVTLLMSETGAHTIAYAFPKVQIITTAIDPEVSRNFYILPGIGNFGDRYYGTESATFQIIESHHGSTSKVGGGSESSYSRKRQISLKDLRIALENVVDDGKVNAKTKSLTQHQMAH